MIFKNSVLVAKTLADDLLFATVSVYGKRDITFEPVCQLLPILWCALPEDISPCLFAGTSKYPIGLILHPHGFLRKYITSYEALISLSTPTFNRRHTRASHSEAG